MKTLRVAATTLLCIALISLSAWAVDKTSTGTGNWNTADTWNPSGVPASGDNVTIEPGHTVTIDAAVSCANLAVGGTLEFDAVTGRSLTVSGDITIATNGTIRASAPFSTGATTQTVSLAGSFVNDGTFIARQSGSTSGARIVNVEMASPSSNVGLSGSAGSIEFNKLAVNLGSPTIAVTPSIDVNFPYNVSGALTLTQGRWLQNSNATNIALNALTIAMNAALSVGGGVFTVATSSLTVNGELIVANGALNVGNAAGNSLIVSSSAAYVLVSGGIVNISGRLDVGSSATVSITGGSVNVSTAGPVSSNSSATFSITSTCTFTMSSGIGVVKIYHGNSGTGGDIKVLTNTAISAGTFIIGSGVGTVGNMRIQSTPSLYNVTVDAGYTTPVLEANLTVTGTLSLASGVLSTGSNKISVLGNSGDAVVIASGSINGEIERAVAAGSTGIYKFTDDHTRITPDGSQGAITVSVKSFPNTDAPNDPTSKAIKRYYSIISSGAVAGTLRLAYAESELRVGQDESQFSLWRYAPPWTDMLSSDLSVAENWVEQRNISTWSNWTISPSGSGLPIQLASFSASVVRDNDVEVVWRTISETNNYGFDIERRRLCNESSDLNPQSLSVRSPFSGSRAGGQASEIRNAQWSKIAFVEGHGTTLTPQSYSYIDRAVPFGHYFYRIRQIDLDGKLEILPEMEVTVGVSPGKFILAQNYPNPFNPNTTIEFVVPQAGRVSLKVYNVLGQEVAALYDGSVEATKIYSTRFEALSLPSGLYFYQLRSTGNVETKRMMLLK